MTVNKIFEIKLTKLEAEELTTLLHESVTLRKEKYEANKQDIASHDLYGAYENARQYRNFFADLCGRRYMGVDA